MSPLRMKWESLIVRAWLSRGPLSCLLCPLSMLMSGLVRLRTWLYRTGFKPSHPVGVPVIVVGNLIAGGAGKTPTVLALVKLLQAQGWKPGIISRGYGGKALALQEVLLSSSAEQVGDEPLLLRQRSGVPVVIGRQRVLAAQLLLSCHREINLIVSDDGLQHLELHRDLQIIVFDERGCGNGWLLPAGPLREPFARQCPERTLVVYNAPAASTPWPGFLGSRRLKGIVPWARWRLNPNSVTSDIAELAQRSQREPVWAAAGIAQPSRFFKLLQDAGVRFNALPQPDHADYSKGVPWPSKGVVVITEKDAVKLTESLVGEQEIWVAPLDFHLDAAFEAALLSQLRQLSYPQPSSPHGSTTA